MAHNTAAAHHRSVAKALARARRVVVRVQGAILLFLLLLVVVLPARGEAITGRAAASAAPPQAPLPQRLSETGLYADGASPQVVRAGNLPFSPQYPLWTDGASKRRWIFLPPGSRIDASDPDAWQFPVGTRLWKEFAHAGRAIETRFIERLPDGQWRFATYVWNLQGSDALLAPERGVRSLPAPGAPGGVYAVPSRADCRGCHEGGASPVLGFGALQLSPDRDPHAPHAETPPPGATDLRDLQARGLLRLLPAGLLDHTPPRIAATSAVARSALGYLHANCGHCHNDAGPLASLDMGLSQSVADAPGSARRTWTALYGKTSRFRSERGDRTETETYRVAPGRVDDSTLLQRMASPHVMSRMPPMGVSVVDVAGIRLIRQWILDHELFSHLKENAP